MSAVIKTRARAMEPGASAEPPSGARPLVLLIDDDEDICNALVDWLDFIGVPCRAFLSAEALLDAVMVDGQTLWLPGPDGRARDIGAAIIDLNLPGMHGLELARHLRAAAPSVRLVIATAARPGGASPAFDAEPGIVWLHKPFSLDSIERTVFPP